MEGATFGNLEKIAAGGNAPTHAATVGTLANACGDVAAPCRFWNVGGGDPAGFIQALAAIQESADGCRPGGGTVSPSPRHPSSVRPSNSRRQPPARSAAVSSLGACTALMDVIGDPCAPEAWHPDSNADRASMQSGTYVAAHGVRLLRNTGTII